MCCCVIADAGTAHLVPTQGTILFAVLDCTDAAISTLTHGRVSVGVCENVWALGGAVTTSTAALQCDTEEEAKQCLLNYASSMVCLSSVCYSLGCTVIALMNQILSPAEVFIGATPCCFRWLLVLLISCSQKNCIIFMSSVDFLIVGDRAVCSPQEEISLAEFVDILM